MVPLHLRALANLPTDQFDTARDVFPGHTVKGQYVMGLARSLAAKAGIRTSAEEVPIIWHGRPEPTDNRSRAQALQADFRHRGGLHARQLVSGQDRADRLGREPWWTATARPFR